MPDTKRNALAELAERLDAMPVRVSHSRKEIADLAKAQRIVAELAKCWRSKAENELVNDYVAAFANCRAIAEEGAEDDKR